MQHTPSKKDIIAFAQKYIAFFENEYGSDQSKFRFFDGNDFPQACDALGFEMDCGKSFCAVDEPSWFHVSDLRTNINKFTDINVIGSGLYSKWRGYNHWGSPYDANEDTKQWYLILLRHLIFLCNQK